MTFAVDQDLAATIDISADDENSNEIVLAGVYGITACEFDANWDDAAGAFFECKVTSDSAWVTYEVNSTAVTMAANLKSTMNRFDPPIAGVWSVRLCSGAPGTKVGQTTEDTVTTLAIHKIQLSW